MTVKDLCNQLIAEGVCPGREPFDKRHMDLCVKISKCDIIDREIARRWNKKRK